MGWFDWWNGPQSNILIFFNFLFTQIETRKPNGKQNNNKNEEKEKQQQRRKMCCCFWLFVRRTKQKTIIKFQINCSSQIGVIVCCIRLACAHHVSRIFKHMPFVFHIQIKTVLKLLPFGLSIKCSCVCFFFGWPEKRIDYPFIFPLTCSTVGICSANPFVW